MNLCCYSATRAMDSGDKTQFVFFHRPIRKEQALFQPIG